MADPKLTREQRDQWGQQEYAARQSDIAAVKAGAMSLAEAQKRARRRSKQSGMTPREAFYTLATARPVSEEIA